MTIWKASSTQIVTRHPPLASRGLRSADTRHLCPTACISVLAHISCPHRPSDHFAGLASGSFSSQWSRQVFSVISRTCSSQSQSPRPHCPLSLCHRLVGSWVSLAPLEEDGQEGLSGPFWPRGQLWLLFDPCPVGQCVRMGRKGHHAPLAHLDNEFPQLPLGYSTAASLVHGAALLLTGSCHTDTVGLVSVVAPTAPLSGLHRKGPGEQETLRACLSGPLWWPP